MNIYLTTGLITLAAAIAIFAYSPNTTLQKLELQSEASTCRDALKSDIESLITIYCNDVIREYNIMIKAHKEEQLRKLIERVQEKG